MTFHLPAFSGFVLILYVVFLLTFNFAAGLQTINDPNLKTEVVFEGLESPTSMAFLGPDDFLVLEKNKGTGTENSEW